MWSFSGGKLGAEGAAGGDTVLEGANERFERGGVEWLSDVGRRRVVELGADVGGVKSELGPSFGGVILEALKTGRLYLFFSAP